MIKIISVINQKGGVGKSTTAQALSSGLHLKKNKKILLVDFDPQCNTTYSTQIDDSQPSIYEALTSNVDINEIIQRTKQYDFIPAGRLLTNLDMEFSTTGKEYKLKEILDPLKEKYHYIIIDTPPTLGLLTVNALTTSDSVIIPAQADIYSLQGIGQLYETIKTVKEYCNQNLKIHGILLTRHNKRTILSRDLVKLLKDTPLILEIQQR